MELLESYGDWGIVKCKCNHIFEYDVPIYENLIESFDEKKGYRVLKLKCPACKSIGE